MPFSLAFSMIGVPTLWVFALENNTNVNTENPTSQVEHDTTQQQAKSTGGSFEIPDITEEAVASVEENDYMKAQDKAFTTPAKKDGRTGMIDHVVEFFKKDTFNNAIVGAAMQAIDKETGKVVDQWVTTKEVYIV